MSGLLFVFSNFAMRAFKKLGPEAGIRAMQQINLDIVNPLFLMIFMGTPFLCAVIALISWGGGAGAAGYWLIPGALIHIGGSLVVTIVGNVPLNNRLAAVDPTSEAGQKVWEEYQQKWLPLNHVRTLATMLSTALLAIGLAVLL
jgi:uncharacterized membrane protein